MSRSILRFTTLFQKPHVISREVKRPWREADHSPPSQPSSVQIQTHGTTLCQNGTVLLWSTGTLPFIRYRLQRLIYFLGAFAKLRKATLNFVMSVRLSAWNNSAHTGRIFMQFYIWLFFSSLLKKIQVPFKFDKNNGYFTWRQVYTVYHNALNSS
jgi:hypothetical protein